MAKLRITPDWMAASSGEPEVAATAALLSISVDDVSLTRSQDVWAKTVRDSVFVSAYPLAMWFASSWWRLNHEPLPRQLPGHDWRMAHELGAANHGYVWPRVVFAPEGEAIRVWAGPFLTPDQSVQYLQGLDNPRVVAISSFQDSVQRFVQTVLARLDARDQGRTDLAHLWAVLQEDLADPKALRRRRLEAELGFDPEECPESMLESALQWEARVGDSAMSEMAPALSSRGQGPDLVLLSQLERADGIVGAPQVSSSDIQHQHQGLPWERAVHDARALRQRIGKVTNPISSEELCGLLGLSSSALANWTKPVAASPVAVAIPDGDRRLRFVPRRVNVPGQRFELARFLGEYLRPSLVEGRWLASTDLGTSRQRYQRAFAAELLCPFESLMDFLDGDYSSYAIDEAAAHFEVSDQVVSNELQNNGVINHQWDQLPYMMAA